MKPFVSEDRNVVIDFHSGLITLREGEEILEVRLVEKDLQNLAGKAIEFEMAARFASSPGLSESFHFAGLPKAKSPTGDIA